MSKTSEQMGCGGLALLMLSIIDIIFIIAFYIVNWELSFLVGLGLGLPYLILCVYALYTLFKSCRCRDRVELIMFVWSIVALLLEPLGSAIEMFVLRTFPPCATFELPEGKLLKVTEERVAWGTVEELQDSPKDYINLGKFKMEYSICLTTQDTLLVWPHELCDSVHSQHYPVRKFPDGYKGRITFNQAAEDWNHIKWNYKYSFMYDGLHTGGSHFLQIPAGDSIDVHIRSILDSRRVDDFCSKDDYRRAK